jgi:serine/threonine protein kinase
VWSARWHRQNVCVKEIKNTANVSKKEMQEFEDECNLMMKMTSHVNVLGFVGLCQKPLLLLIELCDRGSLYDMLHDDEVELPDTLALSIMKDIATGMHHLFEEGIVHKDLAARNVLVAEGKRLIAKVGDFGMSRLLEDAHTGDDEDALAVYVSSNNVGPLKWLAPEVLTQR